MAEYLSPGVYAAEFESGGQPMEGVGTSTAGFIGLAERGPVEGLPQLVTNFSDFRKKYGGYLSENEFGEYRFLAYAVEHFFINGGSRCFIARVAPADAKASVGYAPSKEEPVIRLTAKNPGTWGDDIRAVITPSSKAKTQVLEVIEEPSAKKYKVKNASGFHAGDVVAFSDRTTVEYSTIVKCQDNVIEFAREFEADVVDKNLLPNKVLTTCEFNVEVKYDDQVELYENVSFNIESSNYISKKLAKSDLIIADYVGKDSEESTVPFTQIAGDNASYLAVSLKGGSNGSVSGISASDFIGTDKGAGKRTGIQAFLDNDVVSIMAIPGVTDPNVQLMLTAHCENLAIPPSGSIAGIYARSDNTRGVYKAPANEVVRACVGLDCQFNKGEQDILNPKGVNLICSFPGQGIRVWGARTATSNPSWKYINVRRLFIFIEESIKANTNWAVFEPNDEVLWTRVQRTIEVFLTGLWRGGFLAGSSPAEAFFVNVGRNTMSQDDIDNGRLICVIGAAPVKPAEFVIFRISQRTSDSAE